MARLIFLNRFYWPDEPATAQLLTDLAERLAARGRDVIIIASHPGGVAVPRRETRHNVRIVRVGGTRWSRAGLAGKAADWGTFFFAALWRLLVEVRRNDTVVAMTDPPLLSIGAWFVARLRGARIFHWVQDIYPELAIELTGHRWLAALRPIRNASWRRADGCVTLGAGMAGVLAAAGVVAEKLSIVPNWAPAGLAPPASSATAALRAEWGLAGKFIVSYSGNLGRVHDLAPVLAVAEALRGEPHIAIVFVGDGPQRAALEADARRRKLENVTFRPTQPRARLADSLGLADVHLITLLPGCERYVFPSKLYGVTAVGKPVLFIGPADCDPARVIRENALGWTFQRDDTASLVANLSALSGNAAELDRCGGAAESFAAKGGSDDAAKLWLALLDRQQACRMTQG